MKKNLSLLLLIGFAITLPVSCMSSTELPPDPAPPAGFTSESVAQVISTADVPSPVQSTDVRESGLPPSEQEEDVYEFVSDIHILEDGNIIYNGDGTYDYDKRYFAEFEKTSEPAVLWRGAVGGGKSNEIYGAQAAVSFAKEHWNDGLDVCAPFISRCLRAGGLSISSESSTALCYRLIDSGLGFGQFITINGDRTVTLPDYAAPGDVVQVLCPYEGLMIHSLMFVGNDENGNMKVCCHNRKNSGTYAYYVDKCCYDCTTYVEEIFFYHFYGENEKERGSDIILYENSGYRIPESYDREKAAEYAKNNPADGIGQFGAEHTTRCFSEGGISVGYPVQSALFMQLLKSRLGTAYSLPINSDRTVSLPEFFEEGDAGFIYCPEDGIFICSFIIAGADVKGKMIAYSYDELNKGMSAFKIDSVCVGCGGELEFMQAFHFD